jgi:hypothetical protein
VTSVSKGFSPGRAQRSGRQKQILRALRRISQKGGADIAYFAIYATLAERPHSKKRRRVRHPEYFVYLFRARSGFLDQ